MIDERVSEEAEGPVAWVSDHMQVTFWREVTPGTKLYAAPPAPPSQPGAVSVPTDAMLIAARDWSYAKYGKPIGDEAAIGCWNAMLAAAPRQPEAQPAELCGALAEGGLCILPAGHNMGNLDIPSRHQAAQPAENEATIADLPSPAPLPGFPEGLATGFGDPETLFNSRAWLRSALEAKQAKVTGGGCGCGQADLDILLDGCKFNVSIRPILEPSDGVGEPWIEEHALRENLEQQTISYLRQAREANEELAAEREAKDEYKALYESGFQTESDLRKELAAERAAAVAWIRMLGEECVLAGYKGGDRDVILANVRDMRFKVKAIPQEEGKSND